MREYVATWDSDSVSLTFDSTRLQSPTQVVTRTCHARSRLLNLIAGDRGKPIFFSLSLIGTPIAESRGKKPALPAA